MNVEQVVQDEQITRVSTSKVMTSASENLFQKQVQDVEERIKPPDPRGKQLC